jgi:GT2 family glycosyltransferase
MNIYICFVEKIEPNSKVKILDGLTLSVIIVNYKSWNYLENCLNSLLSIMSLPFELEVVVVDNDVLAEKRQRFIESYPTVRFFGNTGNNGFGNACNLGAENASGDFYLFLNPDTMPSQEVLEQMLQAAVDNEDYGVVSCVQFNSNGSKEKQIRFFPEIKTLFGTFRALYRTRNKKEIEAKFKLDQRIIFPDWVSGSVMLMSKNWFERLGGFNEDYWMYFEDVDFCKRVSLDGGRIALLRHVEIFHDHGGASRVSVKTSALTRSQVLISKHIYVCNYFTGNKKCFMQSLLVLYVLTIKCLGALLGLLLFFIPKMYLRFFVYKNMLSYYRSCLKYKTWLSKRSMNHISKNKVVLNEKSGLIIGFDAKRVYHNQTGLGNYSRDLVSILAYFHKKNKLLLYNPKEKRIDRLAKASNIVEVMPKSMFWKIYSSVWRQGPVVNQLVEDGVQIFHGLSGEIPRGLQSANIKSVVTIHDLIFMRYPKLYKYMDRKIHFKKFLFAAQNSDIVIAISEQTKRDVVEYLHIDPEKIIVVYQGCHRLFKEQQSGKFKESVRSKFGLPKNFILNVGTIEERKNLLLLVKAIKDLDVVLVVVGGKTRYYDTVLQFVIENEMNEKVLFLENVALEELVALYKMANLFVYPSLFEGFGIPIVEALYSKTPVISSKGGCFSEAGGPNSIYVSPTDADELKGKIVEVLSNDILREQMIRKGYDYVQKFNDESVAEQIMSVYKELM